MQKKIMTSLKIHKNLHHRLQQRIIADGYGMRGKSKWIIESIESLLDIEDYPNLVEIAKDMDQLNDIVTVRIPADLMNKIERAIICVRKEYPSIEGVQSNIIRASIVQRMLRQPTSVTEV